MLSGYDQNIIITISKMTATRKSKIISWYMLPYVLNMYNIYKCICFTEIICFGKRKKKTEKQYHTINLDSE